MKIKVDIKAVISDYDNRTLLDNINFEIDAPGLIWIQGENGSGKTILSNVLSGKAFLNRTGLSVTGKIKLTLENKEINTDTNINSYIENISYLPQKLASSLLAIHFQDDLCFPFEGNFPKFSGKNSKEKNSKIIQELNQVNNDLNLWMHLKKKVGECSYGETRRIEFACALSSHSNIIILDEPFSGLDMKYSKAILSYLKTISEINHLIIIVTSHHSPDYYDLQPNKTINLSNNVNSEMFSNLLGEITKYIVRERKHNDENISISEFEIYRNNNQILNISDYNIIADKLNWVEGENGAGKTTLLMFLAGLISNNRFKNIKIHGNISGGIYDGWNIKAPNDKVRVLLQNPYKSFLHNYVLEDIPDVPKSILKILSNWGNIERNPYSFSFGQLKILQFLFIPTKADIILFDEPLLGLHPNLYSLVINSLMKIVDSGRYVIACSESNFINLENYTTKSNLIKLN